LIYLTFEIKSQSRLNRLSSANALAAQWSGLMTSLHDGPELAEIWLKGLHDFDALDPVSKLRFGSYYGRFMKNSEGLYLHVLDKTLDPIIWRGIEQAIRDLINLPGSQVWWKTRQHWYSDNFQTLVGSLIETEDAEELFDHYGVDKLNELNS